MSKVFLKTAMDSVKQMSPLVHNITNYVTVNDCANILLAAHASPIMADDISEVVEITSLCNALVLNIGTLNERTIAAMYAAGKKSSELGHPIILDPVGAGASSLRTETAKGLIKALEVSVIRGNMSEIKALHTNTRTTQGVDANAIDAVTEQNLNDSITLAKQMSQDLSAIIAITGAIDIITDGEKAYVIRNGHAQMSRITGTGCMLSSLIGAYSAANRSQMLEAIATAVALMGICGEQAWAACERDGLGTSTMKTRLIDKISTITPDDMVGFYKGECL